jgi:hypothetical protein
MTSSEAIVKVLEGSRKQWTAVEIRNAAFPLTTGLKGKDPEHTLYMSLYKEARREDGLVIRYESKDGRTLFKLNPKRRALRASTAPAPAKKATTKKATTPRKRGKAQTAEQVEVAKEAAAELAERAAEAASPEEAAALEARAAQVEREAFGEDA